MTATAYLSFLKELSQHSKEYEQTYLDFDKSIDVLRNKIKGYINYICENMNNRNYRGCFLFYEFQVNISFYSYLSDQRLCIELQVERQLTDKDSYIGKMRYTLNNVEMDKSIEEAVFYFMNNILALETF